MLTVQDLIEILKLEPLEQEGGMYCCSYVGKITPEGVPTSTAIYYLLTENTFSHLHRLTADEVYHFYMGDTVELLELLPDGSSQTTYLGQDIGNGEKLQAVIRAGSWQGSHLAKGGKFALLGTTMAPGYTPQCYEHGNADSLIRQYPKEAEKIHLLTE